MLVLICLITMIAISAQAQEGFTAKVTVDYSYYLDGGFHAAWHDTLTFGQESGASDCDDASDTCMYYARMAPAPIISLQPQTGCESTCEDYKSQVISTGDSVVWKIRVLAPLSLFTFESLRVDVQPRATMMTGYNVYLIDSLCWPYSATFMPLSDSGYWSWLGSLPSDTSYIYLMAIRRIATPVVQVEIGTPPSELTVYPNPANSWIKVNYTSLIDALDVLGHQVATFRGQVDVRSWPPGKYFLKSPDGYGQFIKQ